MHTQISSQSWGGGGGLWGGGGGGIIYIFKLV